VVDLGLLEYCIRDELNNTALRRVAVLDPVKVVLTNYDKDKVEYIELSNNPTDENAGKRSVPFSRELYIERSDFEENPPAKFFRLKPDGEVRLMGCYFIKCNEIIMDENGNITELHCTYDPATRSGSSPDGRKVKGTIHWLSAFHAKNVEVRLYDHLFTIENLNDIPEDKGFSDYLNNNSVTILKDCKVEPSLMDALPLEKFQFVRNGYFCKDNKYENVFNRVVTLNESYTKK
jgi:glutaminyl-tRNA synthetase